MNGIKQMNLVQPRRRAANLWLTRVKSGDLRERLEGELGRPLLDNVLKRADPHNTLQAVRSLMRDLEHRGKDGKADLDLLKAGNLSPLDRLSVREPIWEGL